MESAKLGVNIDHIATLRQLRGTPYPDILEAARAVEKAGAHQITVHLREDRRHIQDADVKLLRAELKVALNLEMAATDEMTRFASRVRPDCACLVPEKRQELTTEGGLNLAKNQRRIGSTVSKLTKAGIQVSLFIEPSTATVRTSHELGAAAVELHTGRFCLATQGAFGKRSEKMAKTELERILAAGQLAGKLGLRVHAGHGFDYKNVRQAAALMDNEGKPLIEEFNIGHAVVCRAVLVGLEQATREMLAAIAAP